MVRNEEELVLKERKTGKERRITLNTTTQKAIQRLLDSREYDDDDRLFQGQRGPLTVPTVNRLVKGWCKVYQSEGELRFSHAQEDLRLSSARYLWSWAA